MASILYSSQKYPKQGNLKYFPASCPEVIFLQKLWARKTTPKNFHLVSTVSGLNSLVIYTGVVRVIALWISKILQSYEDSVLFPGQCLLGLQHLSL